jgi:hypothetical protein
MFETKPHAAGTTIVFTHIPKTAGTSLVAALAASLRAHPTHVYDQSMFGTFHDWKSVHPSRRSMVVGVDGRLPPQPPGPLVNSHAALSTTRAAYPDAEHIMVLREGVSRLVSSWLYHRTMDAAELELWGTWAPIWQSARGSLADYLAVSSHVAELDNVTIRQLLWPHPAIPADRAIDPSDDDELLEVARDQLQRLSFVTVLEDPQWVRSLERWVGLVLAVPRLNVTPETKTRPPDHSSDELRTAAESRLEIFSRLDNALWMEVARAAVGEERAAAVFQSARERALRRYTSVLAGAAPN